MLIVSTKPHTDNALTVQWHGSDGSVVLRPAHAPRSRLFKEWKGGTPIYLDPQAARALHEFLADHFSSDNAPRKA